MAVQGLAKEGRDLWITLPPPSERRPSLQGWKGLAALWLLAGYALFCHGCHGDEDNELYSGRAAWREPAVGMDISRRAAGREPAVAGPASCKVTAAAPASVEASACPRAAPAGWPGR